VRVNLRTLIVDDSVGFLDAARSLLERGGLDVVGVADTPEEALRRVAALKPEVVLVDIDLGGASGFDLARELVSRNSCTQRVILISAYSETDFSDLIEESPVVGFIPKTELSADAVRKLMSAAG
jgi:DNA-binding NarL/FixJ family response regulator